MKLMALDIPDDPAQLPGWLERHLVGFELAEVAAQLAAVHGAGPGRRSSVRDVLGPSLEPVLVGGLKAAPPGVLGQLLRRPELLLELQEIVFTEGGPYWDQTGPPPRTIQDILAGGAQGDRGGERKPATRRRASWYRHPAVVAVATAAAVLGGVFLFEELRPAQQPTQVTAAGAWGWEKPGALPEHASRQEYLLALAKAGRQWFNKRPESRADLARRIIQLRQGCSVLIFAEHAPLPPQDRQWLVQKCRAWAGQLTGYLVALENNQDPLQVRAEADQTVRRLVKALEVRAKQLAGG